MHDGCYHVDHYTYMLGNVKLFIFILSTMYGGAVQNEKKCMCMKSQYSNY
jgi:hypothetical protein